MGRLIEQVLTGIVDEESRKVVRVSANGMNANIPISAINSVSGKVVQTILVLTQAQYDAIGTKDASTLYVIEG